MKAAESDPSVHQDDRGELRETVEDTGAWHAPSPQGCKESDITQGLNNNKFHLQKGLFLSIRPEVLVSVPQTLKGFLMLFQVTAQRLSIIPSWELGSVSYHSREYLHMKSYLYLRNKTLCSL